MTTAVNGSRRVRVGRWLLRLALIIGAASALAALAAGPAYRLEILALGVAFMSLRWAAMAAIGGAVLALAAASLLLLRSASGGAGLAWRVTLAFALNAAVAAPPLWMVREAQALPKIHDISTDSVDPPGFVAVLPLRKSARNALDRPAEVAAAQKKGYPDLAPLPSALAPAQALARAEQVARDLGWQIVAVAPADGRLEATDTTLMFGFKDDVVVRVRPPAAGGGAGSVIDVRSVSRVGQSDIGANAKRVRRFLAAMGGG